MPAYRVKLRRGTTAEHANFIGAEGEVTVDTDKKRLVVHDGVTPGGHLVAALTDVNTDVDQFTDTEGLMGGYTWEHSSVTTSTAATSTVINYAVTVGQGYQYGTNGVYGNVFYLQNTTDDGTGNPVEATASASPAIELTAGYTYVFDVSHSSNSGHPLAFTTDGGSNPVTAGVTSSGTPGTAGATVTYIVPSPRPLNLQYYCTVHGTGMGNVVTVRSDAYVDPTYVPFVAGTYYGDRAVVAGGSTMGSFNTIDYFDLTTSGSAIDFGDLTLTRSYTRGASDGTYAVFSGGGGVSGSDTVLDYITVSTASDATTFGTLNREYSLHGSIGDGTYGYAMGGYRITANLDIDRWTMATPGNSSDVGNLTNIVSQFGVWGNGDRTLLTGGGGNGVVDIEYISLQNLSSGASDFGNLTVDRAYCYAAGDSTRAVMAGGRNVSDNDYSDVIDYVTIDTPGNATSFGTLGQTIIEHTATSNLTYGAWTGGSVGGGPGGGGTYNAQINYLTIQTTGTSTDHGDLTVARNNPGSTSGSPS